MTLCSIFIECWITKAKNTQTKYAILTVFPLQQWLHERTPQLRYTTLTLLFPFAAVRFFKANISLLTAFGCIKDMETGRNFMTHKIPFLCVYKLNVFAAQTDTSLLDY
jgi:hypothetical protein